VASDHATRCSLPRMFCASSHSFPGQESFRGFRRGGGLGAKGPPPPPEFVRQWGGPEGLGAPAPPGAARQRWDPYVLTAGRKISRHFLLSASRPMACNLTAFLLGICSGCDTVILPCHSEIP